ncbi:TPA: hypothetical protein JDK69_004795, partial [Salmonella enterica subsp. indica]|nr:hypothetical protein [Salmonella enterica subsp. indica]
GVKGAGAPALNDAVAAMGDEPFDYIGLPFNDTASVAGLPALSLPISITAMDMLRDGDVITTP